MFGRIIHIGCARKGVIAVHVCNAAPAFGPEFRLFRRAKIMRIGYNRWESIAAFLLIFRP